jgi:hypothetical protein
MARGNPRKKRQLSLFISARLELITVEVAPGEWGVVGALNQKPLTEEQAKQVILAYEAIKLLGA